MIYAPYPPPPPHTHTHDHASQQCRQQIIAASDQLPTWCVHVALLEAGWQLAGPMAAPAGHQPSQTPSALRMAQVTMWFVGVASRRWLLARPPSHRSDASAHNYDRTLMWVANMVWPIPDEVRWKWLLVTGRQAWFTGSPTALTSFQHRFVPPFATSGPGALA